MPLHYLALIALARAFAAGSAKQQPWLGIGVLTCSLGESEEANGRRRPNRDKSASQELRRYERSN